MKVIGVDNYARDYNGGRDEEVAGVNLSDAEAKVLAAELNAKNGPHARVYYVVKGDDYVPYKFEGY